MKIEGQLHRIIDGHSLGSGEAGKLMDFLISDIATDIQRAAFLSSMHFKGSTTEELIGFSESLRRHSTVGKIPGLTDIVGTGGDGKNTINVSTASAIAASAMGVKVAKHGNTGFTSKHGSADFMKFIGYDFNRSLETPLETLASDNFLYAFAPRFNNSFAKFTNVRKKLGHRTVFNLMGPITNPFDPDFLVIGTSDPDAALPYAKVLLGRRKKGFVFHSEDGLDEISPSDLTKGYQVNDRIGEITIDPVELSGAHVDLEEVTTADPEECFRLTLEGLTGKNGSSSKFIALNTSPALVINGIAPTFRDAYRTAMKAISDGIVARHLAKLADGRIEINEVS